VRGTLGLMVPLALAEAFSWPALNLVAFVAFLLAFGDLGEDSGWLRRLVAGSVFGSLAVASGALVGGHPVAASVGMLVWGMGAGLAGAYGDGAAAMSLPVAWMYLELGVTAPSHAVAEAARLGALALLGGAWAVLLAWAIKAAGRDRPLRERTAHCFVFLADYLDHALEGERDATPHAPPTTHGYGPSRETQVRAAIADARLLALDTRRRQAASSERGQRLVILIELADQIFMLGGVLKETRDSQAGSASVNGAAIGDVTSADGRDATGAVTSTDWRGTLVVRARAVASALSRHEDWALASRSEAEVPRRPTSAPSLPSHGALAPVPPDEDRAEVRARLASALDQALRLAAGLGTSTPTMPEPEPIPERRRREFGALLAPLRTVIRRQSVVGRHALRFGLVTAVAIGIDRSLAVPFGYWIPLTVTVVLKPYAGSTLTRAGQRLSSTIAGVSVGVLLLPLLTAAPARAVVAAAAFFASLAVLPRNYGVAIFFLSIGIVPIEAMLGGETGWEIGLLRIVNTCVGGALALAGGYLLWPSFERRSLPSLMSATLASMSSYAACVLGGAGGEASSPGVVEAAHRCAGLDNTNLQASFQRVVTEPGESRSRLQASLVVVVTLQRLLLSLNAVNQIGLAGPPARPEWMRVRDLVSRGLADLSTALESRSQPVAMPEIAREARALSASLMANGSSHDGLLARETERIAWQVSALREAIGRLAAADLEAA